MNGRICKALAIVALAGGAVLTTATDATAQIRFGMYGAANYNTIQAHMQDFIPGIGGGPLSSNDFNGSTGIGAYAGLLGAYMIDDRVATVLRASYDQRNAEMETNGSKLATHLSYITIQPGIQVNLGDSPLHLMVGPTMGIKLAGNYTYTAPVTEPSQDVNNGRINNVRSVVFGGWGGLGYDFTLNRPGTQAALFLTPFIEGDYLIDQIDPVDPASTAVMNTLTARLGLQVTMQF
ncbi:MAG TPA: outer membrane beta-barrel protein [Candidatus Kapabacteria bacterium]|nr:outer membrane beta-barrel protein [Candidatus Kapabacteria bacterium]